MNIELIEQKVKELNEALKTLKGDDVVNIKIDAGVATIYSMSLYSGAKIKQTIFIQQEIIERSF